MARILLNWLVLILAVGVADYFIPGISHDSWQTLAIAALVLSFLNAVLKPILALLSLPFILLTLGLFLIVINALLLKLTAWIIPGDGFVVASWWDAIGGSMIISLVSLFLAPSKPRKDADKSSQTPTDDRRPPPGQGPVIDI
jgi:putative membrane protein